MKAWYDKHSSLPDLVTDVTLQRPPQYSKTGRFYGKLAEYGGIAHHTLLALVLECDILSIGVSGGWRLDRKGRDPDSTRFDQAFVRSGGESISEENMSLQQVMLTSCMQCYACKEPVL